MTSLRYQHQIIRRYHSQIAGCEYVHITNGQRVGDDVTYHRRGRAYRNPTAASLARLRRVCKKYLGRGVYLYSDDIERHETIIERPMGTAVFEPPERWEQVRLI